MTDKKKKRITLHRNFIKFISTKLLFFLFMEMNELLTMFNSEFIFLDIDRKSYYNRFIL